MFQSNKDSIYSILVISICFGTNFVQTKSNHSISNSTLEQVNCTKQIDGQSIVNGQSIELNGKIYKMEDCQLDRAYHACGKHLLTILSIVCEVIQHDRRSDSSTFKQIHSMTTSTSTSKIRQRFKRFSRRKLLTEACCLNLCTIQEMTRYCPSR